MPIRQLSETMINQIAAGEVIERPASVVKELVENALDAGATPHRDRHGRRRAGADPRQRRRRRHRGRRAASWRSARHCTSKLADDIHDIRSLGFRGEALPSIGSVSRLTIRSRTAGADSGAEIARRGRPRVAGAAGRRQSRHHRSRCATCSSPRPARLKFMKGERAEGSAITDVVKRIAIAFPAVRFTLAGTDRTTLDLPPADDAGGPAAAHRRR